MSAEKTARGLVRSVDDQAQPSYHIMLVADQPIQDKSKDKLGHAYFSQALGRAMDAYKGKDSIVIGLHGAWGSGKTSIVNMALEHTKELQKEKDEKEHDLIIRFNPWNYSDQNQLIAQFFTQLSIALEEHGLDGKAKEIVPLILKYAVPFVRSAVAAATLNPIEGAEALTQLYDKYKAGTDHNSKLEDLDTIKCELQGLLSDVSAKIIIIIDDIDRLNDVEIRQIFQLVKSLGDFKNTIYLLAFDRHAVSSALDKAQKHSGSKYLEKIVQIPLEVPPADKRKIERILRKGVVRAIEDIVHSPFNIMRWRNIYHSGLNNFFNNIRDVKRYINCLHFRVGLVAYEDDPVNLDDLVVMAALQLFLPEVHSDIKNNEELFTGGLNKNIRALDDSEKRIYDGIIKKNHGIIEEKQLSHLLGLLFPRLIY